MSITKLDCMELKDTRYSVYPYDGYNLEEILCKFYEAIKECNDLSFSLQEFNTWIIDEGLLEEVEKQLNRVDWDNIVNSELYQTIVNRLDETTNNINEINNNVNGVKESVNEINGNINAINGSITKINQDLNNNRTEINKVKNTVDYIAPSNICYFDSYGEFEDCSRKLQELVNDDNVVEIRFSNKDYIFKSKVNIKRKIRLVGANTRFIWKGQGRFLEYLNAPFLIEGCLIRDIIFRGRGKNVGNDIMIYSETPNVCMTIEGCIFYDCNCMIKFHTQSFGHRIVDCSFWGFTNAIVATGNAEQITIDHCWIDDGYRTDNSTNAAIKVEDATSFWIVRTVIQNADIGVSFRGVRNGTIRDCHFENMIDSSIWFAPYSQYENRNCVIDCNWLVGGKRGIYFAKATQKNVHNTISNNHFAYLGDSAAYHINGSASGSCEYSIFMGNSVASEYTSKPLLSPNVETYKITTFQ